MINKKIIDLNMLVIKKNELISKLKSQNKMN